jgi:hypothetical protein
VPWSSIRVGVWVDDGVYVKLCNIDTSLWRTGPPVFHTASGTCTGAPGEYSFEIGFFNHWHTVVLVFVIGPGDRNEAYIPTIDGAWFCPNFDWAPGDLGGGGGRCRTSWSFVPASPSVPYFVATNYTPGSTDGGGTPRP